MRVEFSDLRDHRFNHNFNCISPTCKCEMEPESNEHFLLRCPTYSSSRSILLSNIAIAVNDEILNFPQDHLSRILLFGSPSFNSITNKRILEITLHFIKSTGRFNKIEAYASVALHPPTPTTSPLWYKKLSTSTNVPRLNLHECRVFVCEYILFLFVFSFCFYKNTVLVPQAYLFLQYSARAYA